MKKLMIVAACGILALSACKPKAEENVEQQADATADALKQQAEADKQAGDTADADALKQEAKATKEQGKELAKEVGQGTLDESAAMQQAAQPAGAAPAAAPAKAQ